MCSLRARPNVPASASTFERDEAELGRLLDQYERNLISEDRDRRLLKDYRGQYRDWLDRAKQIMSLADAGRREEAGEMLRETRRPELGERLNSSAVEWIRLNEDLADSASRTVVESLTGSRRRILVANFVGDPADRPSGVPHVSAAREADSGSRRLCQGDCCGGIRQRGSIHARDRRNRRPGPLGRRPEAGRRGDGRAALGEGARVTRDGRAAGRRVAGRIRPAPPVGPRADARRRRRPDSMCSTRALRAAAHRDLRPGGSCRPPDGHPARRGPRGSMRAGTANARARESPARLPAHRFRSRPGGAGPGDGHAVDVRGFAPRGPRVRIVSPARGGRRLCSTSCCRWSG